MVFFDNIAVAADTTREWIILNKDNLNNITVDLSKTGVSPVDLIVKFAEIVYANKEDPIYSTAMEIAAADALLAEQFGFHELNQEARGSRIASVLLGNTEVDAPAPKEEFSNL